MANPSSVHKVVGKFNALRFVVKGTGHFPVDMLRYDRCVPLDSEALSAAFFEHDRPGDRRVEMIMFVGVGYKDGPTTDRWASFGWTVV